MARRRYQAADLLRTSAERHAAVDPPPPNPIQPIAVDAEMRLIQWQLQITESLRDDIRGLGADVRSVHNSLDDFRVTIIGELAAIDSKVEALDHRIVSLEADRVRVQSYVVGVRWAVRAAIAFLSIVAALGFAGAAKWATVLREALK